ncbi:hypothetical protein B484DRAFT_409948, partial [Ochromonadaceae sp. CCMP2298]
MSSSTLCSMSSRQSMSSRKRGERDEMLRQLTISVGSGAERERADSFYDGLKPVPRPLTPEPQCMDDNSTQGSTGSATVVLYKYVPTGSLLSLLPLLPLLSLLSLLPLLPLLSLLPLLPLL